MKAASQEVLAAATELVVAMAMVAAATELVVATAMVAAATELVVATELVAATAMVAEETELVVVTETAEMAVAGAVEMAPVTPGRHRRAPTGSRYRRCMRSKCCLIGIRRSSLNSSCTAFLRGKWRRRQIETRRSTCMARWSTWNHSCMRSSCRRLRYIRRSTRQSCTACPWGNHQQCRQMQTRRGMCTASWSTGHHTDSCSRHQ